MVMFLIHEDHIENENNCIVKCNHPKNSGTILELSDHETVFHIITNGSQDSVNGSFT